MSRGKEGRKMFDQKLRKPLGVLWKVLGIMNATLGINWKRSFMRSGCSRARECGTNLLDMTFSFWNSGEGDPLFKLMQMGEVGFLCQKVRAYIVML